MAVRKRVDRSLRDMMNSEKYVETAKRPMSVLFADMVGSTRFKATHSATDGLHRTLAHNETVAGVVRAYSGRVVKFIGDEVMAEFESADAAVEAAVNVQLALRFLEKKPPITSKIGIHHGEVRYFRYPGIDIDDPQGTAVDLAARIVGAAKGGQILISGPAFDALQSKVNVAATGSFVPRGTMTAMTVHAVEFEGCDGELTLPAYVPYLDERNESLLEQAETEMLNSNVVAAANLAKRVLESDPNHPGAGFIVGMATAARVLAEIDEGILCLERVLKHDPLHFRAMYALAYLVWKQHETTASRESIDRAIDLSRECLRLSVVVGGGDAHMLQRARQNLAYYLAVRGGEHDLAEALLLCELADSFFRESMPIQHARFEDTYGYVLYRVGKKDEARKRFENAITLDRNNSYPHAHLAELLRR